MLTRALGLIVLVALAACAGRSTVSDAGRPSQVLLPARPGVWDGAAGAHSVAAGQARVALMLPQSGSYAALGTAMSNAAEMALFDRAAGAFTLIPIDTGGTAEGARRAMQRALAEDVHLILGPLFSSSVEAISEQAREAGINIISFSTNPAIAGDGVFVMGFLARPQVERVVEYAIAQGATRFAVLAPDSGYGRSVADATQAGAVANGASFARAAYYDPAETDVSDVVRDLANYDSRHAALLAAQARLAGRDDPAARSERARLERLDTIGDPDFDAVLVPEGGNKLLIVTSLLSFYDVDPDQVHYLGTGQWDEPAVAMEPTLKGAWFAAPPPAARADFEQRYEESYGRRPPRIATLAYDAVALAAVLSGRSGGTIFGRDTIAAENGFIGIDGIFRFLPDGLSERGLAVIEVQENEFRMISPSPSRFGTPAG